MAQNNTNRGLASADDQTREEVARKGGQAYHKKRGSHGSDDNTT
jgi:general stress protein YciG